jgi:hypothetical protein
MCTKILLKWIVFIDLQIVLIKFGIYRMINIQIKYVPKYSLMNYHGCKVQTANHMDILFPYLGDVKSVVIPKLHLDPSTKFWRRCSHHNRGCRGSPPPLHPRREMEVRG